jgi:hypothetical protein
MGLMPMLQNQWAKAYPTNLSMFRFYTNAVSNASKNVAFGIFVLGLFLAGIGVLIAAMPQIIGYMVSAIFFVAGIGCAATAVKLYWTIRKLNTPQSGDAEAYRKNVQIHIDNHLDDL